ncbi:MAG TPA: DEAD/DEAH box helicase [Thermoanaerobaculia bacterium]|nr:DEAD/DEAH box helicase [Thermoanaerobaculia bacterium]
MPLDTFHPAVSAWFREALGEPTEAQARAWPAIAGGRHALVVAPTGSGKTLAAFLAALDALVREALASPEGLPDETRVLYVSPLKALSNDIHRNLELPLEGIEARLAALGLPAAGIRRAVRTGDTPPSERSRMARRPPHVLVTTPESLYILLGSRGGRRMLSTVRTVIVDEVHAVAGNKRGSHLALSLARLEELVGRTSPEAAGSGTGDGNGHGPGGARLTRIGLSATVAPVGEVARFLTGAGPAGEAPPCEIIDAGRHRHLDLAVEVPPSPLEALMSNQAWEEIYDRLADLVRAHRTTLVFVNTRRTAERAARHLAERLGEENVAAHHGSLSKEQRLASERRLKAGELAVLVATSSLELGIDIGSVELVCQLGSTRTLSALLQRIGRAEHHLGGVPKGRLFPLTRDELVEAAALMEATGHGEIDRLVMPSAPLDLLAQQIVAAVADEEWSEDALFATFRRAWPYRHLERGSFDDVVAMLAQGFATARGRRAAYLHHDAVHRRLRGRRGARLTALTSGGAIPDVSDYQVVLEPTGTVIGTVNEDFAVESLPGHVFQLGNASWRILKIEQGRLRVADAHGETPTIPFWFGEAPARSEELSAAVSRVRRRVEELLEDGAAPEEAAATLAAELALSGPAALQLVEYLAAGHAALGVLPTTDTLVAERFFDEAGDAHLVIHSPLGSRINRAWGLALRKRFCRSFNFELQAAATEDAIILSLGPTHSFPLETVFQFLHSTSARDVLVQALLDSPLFGVRWRWNAARSLALPRMRNGRRVPAPLQRQQSEDLLAVVFPDQLACLENVEGDREIPDHPLVAETLRDCLDEAMDADGFLALLVALESGAKRTVARDLASPSLLAQEVLTARPYAYLDDAPAEERRTLAVASRRWMDPKTAADLGALDAAAIERVRDEVRPEARDADELHDALVTQGFVPEAEGEAAGWGPLFAELAAAGRATLLATPAPGPAVRHWIAAERLAEALAAWPGASLAPAIEPPVRASAGRRSAPPQADDARRELLRSWLDTAGPVTAAVLAATAGMPVTEVERSLVALEAEGAVMRGRFTPGAPAAAEEEWCERRLLARIHRATLERLRSEIAPVGRADLLRFLLVWQRAAPEERGEGPEALAAVLRQLRGFAAPAAAWEEEILPARLAGYDPAWLDVLCLAGRVAWCRPAPPADGRARQAPLRTTPMMLLPREELALWRRLAGGRADDESPLSSAADQVRQFLAERGASFFTDLAAGTGLLATQVESALAELAAAGRVTSDSFAGLRALLLPADRRPRAGASSQQGRAGGRAPARSVAAPGMESAGRWSLLPESPPAAGGADEPPIGWTLPPADVESAVRALLDRYGILFRALLAREDALPPWREVLWVLRRLEARGEVRGGRFVDGFAGEQYALPEAVARLRSLRRAHRKAESSDTAAAPPWITVSGADPLNLAGILTPGAKLPALTTNRLLYRDGLPLAVREAREVKLMDETLPPDQRWAAEQALVRSPRTAAARHGNPESILEGIPEPSVP